MTTFIKYNGCVALNVYALPFVAPVFVVCMRIDTLQVTVITVASSNAHKSPLSVYFSNGRSEIHHNIRNLHLLQFYDEALFKRRSKSR